MKRIDHEKESTLVEFKKVDETFQEEVRKFLASKRIVFITGEITQMLADVVSELLTYVALKGRQKIKIVLNSVGGDVYAVLLIYNTVKQIVNDGIAVEIEARGLAASGGCVILQAGSKRTAPKATRFLLHELQSWDEGKVSEIEEKAEEARKLNNMLRDIVSERSGQSKEEIDRRWSKKDLWYSAEEAKQYGLIDEII